MNFEVEKFVESMPVHWQKGFHDVMEGKTRAFESGIMGPHGPVMHVYFVSPALHEWLALMYWLTADSN